jgi:hypothetical protein
MNARGEGSIPIQGSTNRSGFALETILTLEQLAAHLMDESYQFSRNTFRSYSGLVNRYLRSMNLEHDRDRPRAQQMC